MNPVNLSGLGAALSRGASAFTQGLNDAPVLAYQQAQRDQTMRGWERTNQEQDLLATPGQQGETDVERLERLAAMADQTGRGDLASKLRGEATSTKQKLSQQSLANGAKAIMAGQFGAAVEHLNRAGTLGQIHSIQQKEPGLYGVTWIDDAGQPQVTDVNYQMLAALAADPGELDKWMAHAADMDQKAKQQKAEFELKKAAQEEKERHNKANEVFTAWKAKHGGSGGGKAGSSRKTDYAMRLEWATSEAGMAHFKGDMGAAQQWAANPAGVQQSANAAYRLAGQSAMTGIFGPEDIGRIMSGFIGNGPGAFPTVRPGGAGGEAPPAPAVDFRGMGFTEAPDQPGTWINTKSGVRFRDNNGKIEAWSNKRRAWVPAQ